MHALEVIDLVKEYPSWKSENVRAVNSVTFSVDGGDIVGLLGPNGAGKTTIIKCICDLINPTSGMIKVFEQDIRGKRVALDVAAVLEGNRNIYWRLTAEENLEFFAGLQGLSPRSMGNKISTFLNKFGLEGKKDTPARKLSRGMQQKLALGCALIRETPFLLLDEPTLGLDVETSIELRKYIKELANIEGKTVLLSSHDMNVVEEVCERVVIINEGNVVADDKIDNLKEFFNIQTYEIGVTGPIGRSELMDEFESVKIKIRDGHTKIKCQLKDSRAFYKMIHLLEEKGCEVQYIKSLEPDFEEIFLKVLNRRMA
ncbi:MAG: ABC transporter ATP-binding protein [Thermoplasmata archaeon]